METPLPQGLGSLWRHKKYFAPLCWAVCMSLNPAITHRCGVQAENSRRSDGRWDLCEGCLPYSGRSASRRRPFSKDGHGHTPRGTQSLWLRTIWASLLPRVRIYVLSLFLFSLFICLFTLVIPQSREKIVDNFVRESWEKSSFLVCFQILYIVAIMMEKYGVIKFIPEILPQTDNWPGTEKFLRSVVDVIIQNFP